MCAHLKIFPRYALKITFCVTYNSWHASIFIIELHYSLSHIIYRSDIHSYINAVKNIMLHEKLFEKKSGDDLSNVNVITHHTHIISSFKLFAESMIDFFKLICNQLNYVTVRKHKNKPLIQQTLFSSYYVIIFTLFSSRNFISWL